MKLIAGTTKLLIPGDGVGPEIIECGVQTIEALKVRVKWTETSVGHEHWIKTGHFITEETLELFDEIPVILKGPLTTPATTASGSNLVNIRGMTFTSANQVLRRYFQLFANVRPAKYISGTKTPFVGTDLVVIRENTEGAYTGEERMLEDGVAEGVQRVTRSASRRIAKFAMEYALEHNRSRVTTVHKANVLKVDRLFLEQCNNVAKLPQFKNIKYDDHLADSLMARLVLEPTEFDVLLCPNLFGDLISDLAGGLVGPLGLSGSGIFGENHALFEPVHGSAPDIVGKGIVNPVSILRSATMMLRHLNEHQAAMRLDASLDRTIQEGKYLTPDLGGSSSTKEMNHAIIQNLD